MEPGEQAPARNARASMTLAQGGRGIEWRSVSVIAILVLLLLVATFAQKSGSPVSPAPSSGAVTTSTGTDDATLSRAQPRGPTPTEQHAAIAGVQRLMATMKGCDDAVDHAIKVAKRADAFTAYSAVSDAQSTCADAQDQISQFRFSDQISSPRREQLKAMLGPCGQAYLVRELQMQEVANVLNGDTSPAVVVGVQHSVQTVNQEVAVCVAAIFGSVSAAGFDAHAITRAIANEETP